MYRIVFPCEQSLKQMGRNAERLVGIPIVIAGHGQLEGTVTDYLIERATGSWAGVSGARLSRNSIAALAGDITNFLNYFSSLRLDWVKIERGDENKAGSLLGYANAMDAGNWAQNRRPIKAQTISRRLNAAQDLLCYAASRGRRPPYVPRPIMGYGARKWTVRHRIVLPSDQALEEWFGRLRARECRRNYLMARMPFETGMRKEEIIRFPVSAVPDIEEIQASKFTYLSLEYGTKGGRSRHDMTLRGKPRTTRVASTFALQLHTYKNGASQRESDLQVARLKFGSGFQPSELFFNPNTGSPFSKGHLNSIFSRHSPPEVKPWHPHVGRHYYACKLLVELISKSVSASILVQDMTFEKFGALADRAIAAVQGFLGHEHQDTTERYVRWAYSRMVAESSVEW